METKLYTIAELTQLGQNMPKTQKMHLFNPKTNTRAAIFWLGDMLSFRFNNDAYFKLYPDDPRWKIEDKTLDITDHLTIENNVVKFKKKQPNTVEQLMGQETWE